MAEASPADAARTVRLVIPHDRRPGASATGKPAYPKAICLALVEGVKAALRSAAGIDRRAAGLLVATQKLRTKGAEPVIQKLLNDDAVSAMSPGGQLSRRRRAACLIALLLSRRYANYPAARRFESSGYDHGRITCCKAIPPEKK